MNLFTLNGAPLNGSGGTTPTYNLSSAGVASASFVSSSALRGGVASSVGTGLASFAGSTVIYASGALSSAGRSFLIPKGGAVKAGAFSSVATSSASNYSLYAPTKVSAFGSGQAAFTSVTLKSTLVRSVAGAAVNGVSGAKAGVVLSSRGLGAAAFKGSSVKYGVANITGVGQTSFKTAMPKSGAFNTAAAAASAFVSAPVKSGKLGSSASSSVYFSGTYTTQTLAPQYDPDAIIFRVERNEVVYVKQ